MRIDGAWARATAPQQDSGVIYLEITAPAGDRLLSVSSTDADSAMLHQTTSVAGMAGMTDMDGIDVPAGQTVHLAPHGAHIMLMGLRHPLVAGDFVAVDLRFGKAGTVHLRVPVQTIRAAGPPG